MVNMQSCAAEILVSAYCRLCCRSEFYDWISPLVTDALFTLAKVTVMVAVLVVITRYHIPPQPDPPHPALTPPSPRPHPARTCGKVRG